MKEKLKIATDFIKKLAKNTAIYSVIIVATIASFYVGMYYNKTVTEKKGVKIEVTKVLKQDVNLAIDENNNLIVIENKSGNYTIYQDSIGETIFKLYAKNVWGQHSTISKEPVKE